MNALAHHDIHLLGRSSPPEDGAAAQPATRVLVVEQSRLLSEALMFTIESDPKLEPIGYALDGWEALELISAFEPDALLVGAGLVGLDALAFTRLVHMVWPQLLIIVLAEAQVPRQVEEAYAAGASDYLPHDRSADELLDAIHAARSRRQRVDRKTATAERAGRIQLAHTRSGPPWMRGHHA